MSPRPHIDQPERSEVESKASPPTLRLRHSRGYSQSERESNQRCIRVKAALMSDFEMPPVVLVVDDDPDQVDSLIGLLSQHGMVPLPAYSGQQCLDMVRQNPIDIIILDLEMPGISGLEVCAALKKEIVSHSLAVIILTARDDMETRIEGVRLGITEFITKPSNSQVLITRFQTQVEICRKVRELHRTT